MSGDVFCSQCAKTPCQSAVYGKTCEGWYAEPPRDGASSRRKSQLREAIGAAAPAALDGSTHKCASTLLGTLPQEADAWKKACEARPNRKKRVATVGPLREGQERERIAANVFKVTMPPRGSNLGGAEPWPVERYLKPGFLMGDVAMNSRKWAKEKLRVLQCGQKESDRWLAGRRRDNKTFCSPVQCHSKRHKNCRVTAINERIDELQPVTMLTLTDRNSCADEEWKDLRHLTMPKRLARFWNMWGKDWGRPSYVWCKECHESGFPHVHAVLRQCFEVGRFVTTMKDGKEVEKLRASVEEEEQIASWWKLCGGGWSVQWEMIEKTGHYIAGYLNSQVNVDERRAALIYRNKLRDWGSSKGIRRPRSMLKVWETVRGSREKAEQAFERFNETKG